jgi:predicted ATPase
MQELDKITIRGFKSIRSIEGLGLGTVNLLIGANGSGKSNFIGVFAFLHAIREGKLEDYVSRAGGANRILHFGAKTTKRLEIEISFANQKNGYSVALEPTSTDQLFPSSEIVSFWDKQHHPKKPFTEGLARRGNEAGISDPALKKIPNYVRQHLGSWRLYHFHDTSSNSPMKGTADLEDNRFLRPDGSNLAAFLYLLRQKHELSYGLIRKTVQLVAPFFDDFQLEPSNMAPDKIRLEWRHKGSDAYFDASSLSDGTLRFIALVTLFMQPESLRPSVILVDEPELGLHPYAITMLASVVRQASTNTQAILSTQSPLLLDNFEPENVLVAERVKGGTELRRLETERLSAWLSEYSLGQLWEKNELGGRPSGDR